MKNLTFVNLALALANDYSSLYVIDSENDNYVEYTVNGTEKELVLVSRGDNFFKDTIKNCRELVYEDDQEYFLATFRKESVQQALKNGKSFSLTYRLVIEGKPQYFFLKTIQGNDRNIVIGVQNVDEQKRKELEAESEKQTYSEIAQALARRYEIIYHVNIVTDEYSEYGANEKYRKLAEGEKGKDFFNEISKQMKLQIYPDDLPMLAVALQKENLLNSLSAYGKTVFNYRLIIDGRPQYVSLYAVRPKKDSEHIIIALANVDETKRMELAYLDAVDMANRDILTGVKNKRAYVQLEIELDEQIKNETHQEFAIVVCDINGLKQVNDTQGHKAGDEFIQKASSVICDIFKHSPVFRIGGDEFAIILKGQDYLHRMKLMQHLHIVLTGQKQSKNEVILLASGISEFQPEKDIRVQDVFERADSLMYQDKKKCKSQSADTKK